MKTLLAVLLLAASASSSLADEGQKKNPWERYNHPGNVFNTAKPSEALRPGCTDMKNCLGRNHLPKRRATPDNPTPARQMPTER